jgi:hypothetical protein
LLAASLVSAQPGRIQIFSDGNLTDCNLTDNVAGLLTVYIYHINTGGATASSFGLDVVSGGSTLTFLYHQSPYLVAGAPPSSFAISYGACLGQSGPVEILTIHFSAAGNSPACSYIEIVDDPTADPVMVQVTDCAAPNPNLSPGEGSIAYINDGDGSCSCITIPVEDTSWGQIKALYR